MSRSSTCIIPTVGLDSEGVPTVEGSAVFNAGQLAGYLSGDETVILSLLKESHGGGYIPSLQISESTNISLEISQNKSSARAKLKDHTPELFITMRTTAALSRASGRCDLLDESTRKLIKTAAEEHLNARIDALIRRIRTENLGDPLFWKHAIQTACPDWWAQNPDLHNSIIKTVPIHRDVRVALNSAGMTKHTLTFE